MANEELFWYIFILLQIPVLAKATIAIASHYDEKRRRRNRISGRMSSRDFGKEMKDARKRLGLK